GVREEVEGEGGMGKETRNTKESGAAVRIATAREHLARDGPLIAVLYMLRSIDALLHRLRLRRRPRDAGEAAAERFLRALGYRTVARNWRSPRDPRDEADLLMLAPDATTLVIVEVKRARGPWDALDRVDRRKRSVLWRILCDLTDGSASEDIAAAAGADSVRVDLVGARGEGYGTSAVRHVVGLFERPVRARARSLIGQRQ
ncbi:MAG: YraN family protein, partial [bacterium]